jgi:ferredoxin
MDMPRVEVVDRGTFDVEPGTRLVRAIEGHGVDILHRCGGFARCTTCRVEFVSGEPEVMTVAEREKLADKGVLGQVRLSCQIVVEQDMTVRVINTLAASGLPDPGPEPEPTVTPEPQWEPKP